MIFSISPSLRLLAGVGLGAVLAVSSMPLLPKTTTAAGAADTLRVAMYSGSAGLGNPFSGNGGGPNVFFFTAVYDGLTRVDQDGKLVPWAATSWETSDELTWTIKLRPNMWFSNGEPHDAHAIAASWNYLCCEEEGKAQSMGRQVRNVAGARAIDDLTLEVKTKKPDPTLMRVGTGLVAAAPKAWKDLGVEGYAANPPTSGPWKVEQWREDKVSLTAFDKTWRPGKINNIEITSLPETITRVQALLSDQMDIIIGLGPDNVEQVEGGGHLIHTYPSPITMSVALFTTDFPGRYGAPGSQSTPFVDQRVRQAVNYAVNREAILKDLLNGYGRLASQPANPSTFGYNPDVKPYPYNPKRAKRLLSEAGYGDGFPLLMEVVTGALPNDSQIYTFVAQELRKIGIDVELRQLPLSEYIKKILGGTFEAAAIGLAFRVEPQMDIFRTMQTWSCRFPKPFLCHENEVPLLTAADQELDPVKREKMLQDLMRTIHDDAIALFLVNHVDVYGVNKRVKGFDQWNLSILYERMQLDG